MAKTEPVLRAHAHIPHPMRLVCAGEGWQAGMAVSEQAVDTGVPAGAKTRSLVPPERRNMRHTPAYRPVIAPYDAQDAVLRVTGRVFARARDVEQSVKKMNPVARLVRRLHIDDALVQLALINKKKAARALYEVRPRVWREFRSQLLHMAQWAGMPVASQNAADFPVSITSEP